ncbi:glycosyltransferase family 2 protein [Vibrio astriarenae]
MTTIDHTVQPQALPPETQDKVLVVIPCFNEVNYIERIVTFCFSETTHPDSLVVVADGGSCDGTLDILNQLQNVHRNLVVLNNPKKIQSSGVNLAVTTYGTDFEVFIRIDVHADYPAGYISSLIHEQKTTQAASVVVSMDTQGKTAKQKLIAATQNSALGNGGSGHRNSLSEGQWVEHGHHALMHTQTFLQVQGYDESFSHNEDAELDARITLQGGKIWLTASTGLTYYPRDSFAGLFKQYKGYGSGRCKTLFKHKMKPKLRQLIPVFVFPAVALSIFSFLTPIVAIPGLVWLLLVLFTGALISKPKTLSGSSRYLIGVPAIVMHFAWSLGFCQQCLKQLFVNHKPSTKQVATNES